MAIGNDFVVSLEYEAFDQLTKDLVDGNVGHAPLEFIMGKNQIIPGLENGLRDLNPGDKADIAVKAADAYGEYNDEAVDTLPKEQFSGIDLTEGMTLYGQDESGQTIPVVVKSFSDENVTIDYNHPMAGKDLMFSVTVVSVRMATPQEVSTGQVAAAHDHGGGSCGTGGGSCGCSH
jgi:FKBP-type peptidyl-prolyl cis-trans isomerase SlyD